MGNIFEHFLLPNKFVTAIKNLMYLHALPTIYNTTKPYH